MLVREHRVLLCRRRRDREWHPAVWDLPGGHVEPGESPARALTRELCEELGVAARPPRSRYDVEIPEGLLSVFVVHHWRGEPANKAPEEHDAIGWFSVTETDQLELADVRLSSFIHRVLTAAPVG